jgi:hypothetical protein
LGQLESVPFVLDTCTKFHKGEIVEIECEGNKPFARKTISINADNKHENDRMGKNNESGCYKRVSTSRPTLLCLPAVELDLSYHTTMVLLVEFFYSSRCLHGIRVISITHEKYKASRLEASKHFLYAKDLPVINGFGLLKAFDNKTTKSV